MGANTSAGVSAPNRRTTLVPWARIAPLLMPPIISRNSSATPCDMPMPVMAGTIASDGANCAVTVRPVSFVSVAASSCCVHGRTLVSSTTRVPVAGSSNSSAAARPMSAVAIIGIARSGVMNVGNTPPAVAPRTEPAFSMK